MIIDVNASVGHYPFRSLGATNARQLIAAMDRHGITRAVVPSLQAVFYRDAQRGNEELMDDVAPHAARLIPVPTINPAYVGWERDFAQAVETWKVKVVTLTPEYHGYALTDARGRAALDRIDASGLPLLLTQRLEDRRQRHAWDRAEDLTVNGLLEIARLYPKMRFLLANWAGLDGARLAGAGLKGRCLIDFARLQVVFRQEVPKLIAELGVESLAFGSHQPFDYLGGSLVKLANVQATLPADYEAIAWRNAARFLDLRD